MIAIYHYLGAKLAKRQFAQIWLLLICLCSSCSDIEFDACLVLSGDENVEVQEQGRVVLSRDCDADEANQILMWVASVSSVENVHASFVTYAPSVVVRSREWSVNFCEDKVVLNCCPADDGALSQYVWDAREEDIQNKAHIWLI